MSKDNLKFYDVVIIGGGASGLMCAIQCKKQNRSMSVCVAESQDRVGKKLLVTGNGRCNLTNLNILPEMYHGSFSFSVKELMNSYPPQKIIDIFDELGLMTISDHEGRVYPLSKQANSVLDILRKNADRLGVETLTNFRVSNISYQKGKYCLKSETSEVFAKKVVVATGSKASPSTGADDNMLTMLEKLGHTITPLSPALCPVTVKSPYLKSLKGVRVSAKATVTKGDKFIKEEYGEVQFTENALSGICIFNLSRIANTLNDTKITLALLPEFTTVELFERLKVKAGLLGKDESAEELTAGYFHKMVGLALLKEAGISPALKLRDIDDDKLMNLCKTINNWSFSVISHRDFSKAQVVAGGVSGKEIDMHTFESKLFRNLYIIGEATDCDGDCGGMNLQFAFASGCAAAKDISKL